MEVYNNQEQIHFFLEVSPCLSIPQAKNLSLIIESMIESSSIITSNIASVFKGNFKLNKPESNEKRVYRFWHNSHINMENVFDNIIQYIFKNFKVKHEDTKVYISFDHSFNRDDFVSLVVSFSVGKQAIPIYYRCFEADDKTAFSMDTIKEALTKVHDYFPNCEIIFLADRWFGLSDILDFIENIGAKYVIRVKTNVNVSIDGDSFVSLSDIKPNLVVTKSFENILFTETQQVKTNLVVTSSKNTDDPWYLVTNEKTKYAVKHYAKRFGGIEFIFKDQKSNGFNLEKTTTRNIEVFKKMFGATCVGVVWLTILGADYVKNKIHYKNKINFYDTKKVHGNIIRDKSLFRLGKEIFKYLLDTPHKILLKYNFKLYDL